MTNIVPNSLPCPHCGRWKNRPVTVDGIVVNDGRILLIKRAQDPAAGCWALPGGYVSDDETLVQAALREVAEETGVIGYEAQFVGMFDDPNRGIEQCITTVYRILIDGSPKPFVCDQQEILEVAWFELANLPELAFDHNAIVEAFLRTNVIC